MTLDNFGALLLLYIYIYLVLAVIKSLHSLFAVIIVFSVSFYLYDLQEPRLFNHSSALKVSRL